MALLRWNQLQGPTIRSAGAVESGAVGCVGAQIDRFEAMLQALRRAPAMRIHRAAVSEVRLIRRPLPAGPDCAWQVTLTGYWANYATGTPSPNGGAAAPEPESMSVVGDVLVDAAKGDVEAGPVATAPTPTPALRSPARPADERAEGSDDVRPAAGGATPAATMRPYILTIAHRTWRHDSPWLGPQWTTSRFVYSDSDHYRFDDTRHGDVSSSPWVRSGHRTLMRYSADGTPSANYRDGRSDSLPPLLRDGSETDGLYSDPFILGAPIQDLAGLDASVRSGQLIDLGIGRLRGRRVRGVGTRLVDGRYHESWFDPQTGVKLQVRFMSPGSVNTTEVRRLDLSYQPRAEDFEIHLDPMVPRSERHIVAFPPWPGVDAPRESLLVRTLPTDRLVAGHRAQPAILVTDERSGPDAGPELKWAVMQELVRADGASITVASALPRREIMGLDPFWPWNWPGDTPFHPEHALFLFAQPAQLGDGSPVKVYTTHCAPNPPIGPRHVVIWSRDGLTTIVLSDCRHDEKESALAVAQALTR